MLLDTAKTQQTQEKQQGQVFKWLNLGECHNGQGFTDACDGLLLAVGLRPQNSDALKCVVTNALNMGVLHRNLAVKYSRAGDAYPCRQNPQNPKRISVKRIKNTVDALARESFLQKRNGYHSRNGEGVNQLSTFQALPKLLDFFEGVDLNPTNVEDAADPIVFKRNGNVVQFLESRNTRQMRLNIQRINAANRARQITLPIDENEQVKLYGHMLEKTDQGFSSNRVTYHRVFNDKWSHGGRFYGPWWQSIGSKFRSQILIDGKPVVERDFCELHPFMLYTLEGLPLPDIPDLYLPQGRPKESRKMYKIMWNTALNALTRQQAFQAMQSTQNRRGNPGNVKHDFWEAMLQELEAMHKPIAHHLATGVGIRLQCYDSLVAEQVMLTMIAQELPCLCVHDSFLTWAEHDETLQDVMRDAYTQVMKGPPPNIS